LQVWGELHDLPETRISRQPHLLARAQALDAWAAGRERAIAKLVQETEVLEEYGLIEEAACLWHAVLRLQERAQREHAEADALRVARDRRKKKHGNLKRTCG
jgi:hypothetical protein